MIQTAAIWLLLDSLRAQTIAMIGTGRDAYAYGEIAGRLASIDLMRVELNNLIEENAGNDDYEISSPGTEPRA